MNEVLTSAPVRFAAGFPRYMVARFLNGAAAIVLHPVITLPVLVFLLGGQESQIVWYAIVAGVAAGLSAPSGTLVALRPNTSRIVITVLLATQAIGFLISGFVALLAAPLSNSTILDLAAIGYLLLIVPTAILSRITEQSHEFRRSSAASVQGVIPAIIGTLLAGLMVWRFFGAGSMGPDDLLARALLAGALFAITASWLATYRTLLAMHLPHPARPMPSIRSPRLLSNKPLIRYSAFQLIHGITRFADPFLVIGVLTIIVPEVIWIGGAVIAFTIGDTAARLVAISAFTGKGVNVRALFTLAAFLHAIALLTIAFGADVLESSIIADRNPSVQWQNWAIVIGGLALGTSYRFAQTGHQAYVRSISSPQTRDLSLTVVGVVMIITAFSPIIAVRLLQELELSTVLQIGAGASILTMFATALIVQPFSPPRRRRRAWGLRGL